MTLPSVVDTENYLVFHGEVGALRVSTNTPSTKIYKINLQVSCRTFLPFLKGFFQVPWSKYFSVALSLLATAENVGTSYDF